MNSRPPPKQQKKTRPPPEQQTKNTLNKKNTFGRGGGGFIFCCLGSVLFCFFWLFGRGRRPRPNSKNVKHASAQTAKKITPEKPEQQNIPDKNKRSCRRVPYTASVSAANSSKRFLRLQLFSYRDLDEMLVCVWVPCSLYGTTAIIVSTSQRAKVVTTPNSHPAHNPTPISTASV